MGRLARIVVPGLAHHVTQRGNRRSDVFLFEEDREHYLSLLDKYSSRYGLEILGYCLMTNHVHLVVVPQKEGSLARAIRDAHTVYALRFNKREELSGHLWQGRFYSCVVDEAHFWSALRYVETNPVRAGLVGRAEEYRWSSAATHCGLREDRILSSAAELRGEIGDWRSWLMQEDQVKIALIRKQTHTGRPCGSGGFIERLEALMKRALRPGKRGPKAKKK